MILQQSKHHSGQPTVQIHVEFLDKTNLEWLAVASQLGSFRGHMPAANGSMGTHMQTYTLQVEYAIKHISEYIRIFYQCKQR